MMTSVSAETDSVDGPESAKSCFVVAPIGSSGSDVRKRSDQVLRHVIRPAVEPLGYKVVRADEIDQSGSINAQVISRITDSHLVIADLTDLNPNVLYELALRHALRKPFVQLAAEGQRLPFDVADLRTIFLDYRDLDSAAEARAAIMNAVEGIEKGEPIETPMSYALELKDLRGSGDPEQKATAQILEGLRSLRRDVSRQQRSGVAEDVMVIRRFIAHLSNSSRLESADRDLLITSLTSNEHDRWIDKLHFADPDLWADHPAPATGSFDEEPPF
jgi:hypothetical protein